VCVVCLRCLVTVVSVVRQTKEFSRQLASWTDTPVPAGEAPLLDYGVLLDGAEWRAWQERVPRLDIETHQVGSPDVVIATVDTVRHEEVLRGWLAEHRPLILCGPPGSGMLFCFFFFCVCVRKCALKFVL
jgi:dynein heavy chain 1